MYIEAGSGFSGDVIAVQGGHVSFVATDGRTMFSVHIGRDGRSIEVRGVETCVVNGVMYSAYLEVLPNVANSITVRTRKYDE